MRYLFTMLAAMFLATTAVAAEPAPEPASQPATQPTSQPTTAPATVVPWDQAVKHVGETVTVTGPVVSTHVSANKQNLTLNVGKDFPDPGRLTLFMPNDPKAGSPDELYKGKTVTVTGKIVLYRKLPEIKCTAKDVAVSK